MSTNIQTYFRKLLFNAREKNGNNFNKKIFFYTTSPEGSAEGAYFQDLIVNLGKSFQHLKVQYYSSNNYWKLSPKDDQCLLQSDPHVKHQDCDMDKIAEEPEILEKIAIQGRAWVLQNSSPKAVALRFMEKILKAEITV